MNIHYNKYLHVLTSFQLYVGELLLFLQGIRLASWIFYGTTSTYSHTRLVLKMIIFYKTAFLIVLVIVCSITVSIIHFFLRIFRYFTACRLYASPSYFHFNIWHTYLGFQIVRGHHNLCPTGGVSVDIYYNTPSEHRPFLWRAPNSNIFPNWIIPHNNKGRCSFSLMDDENG